MCHLYLAFSAPSIQVKAKTILFFKIAVIYNDTILKFIKTTSHILDYYLIRRKIPITKCTLNFEVFPTYKHLHSAK